jgi:hypothetical protein
MPNFRLQMSLPKNKFINYGVFALKRMASTRRVIYQLIHFANTNFCETGFPIYADESEK